MVCYFCYNSHLVLSQEIQYFLNVFLALNATALKINGNIFLLWGYT